MDAKAERKEREFLKREREILDRAASMILQEEWLSITVEKVAAATGIGKGTVYLHFRTKSDIFGALLADFKEGLLGRLEELPDPPDFSEGLRSVVKLLWSYHREGGLYARRLVLFCEGEGFFNSLSEPFRERLRKVQERLLSRYRILFEKGMEGGELPRAPLDPLLLAAASVLEGALRLFWSLEGMGESPLSLDADTFDDYLARFILRGAGVKSDF